MSSSSTRVFESQDQDQPGKAEPSIRPAPDFIHNRPALARHRRKCSICRHPERDTIEDLFIHWHSPSTIANIFDDAADDAEDAGDDSANRLRITWVAIYRHAYAVGLDEVRRRNLRFAFEHILEQAGDITPTSASIMAAARAYAACVNPDGHWNDPPKQVIVTNILKRETPLTEHPASAEPSQPIAAALRVIPNPAAAAVVADAGEGSAVAFASTPLCHTASQLRDADSSVDVPRASLGDASPSCSGRSITSNVIPNPAATVADVGEGSAVVLASMPPCVPASDSRAEIRIPANSLITNDREISNR